MINGTTQQNDQEDNRRGADDQLSSIVGYVRAGVSSGLFAGVAGLVTVARVRHALREESSERATKQAMLAVFWIGVAMTQWGVNRSSRQTGPPSGGGASHIVDRVSDIGGISAGSGEEPSEDSTSIDITELNPTPDVEDDGGR